MRVIYVCDTCKTVTVTILLECPCGFVHKDASCAECDSVVEIASQEDLQQAFFKDYSVVEGAWENPRQSEHLKLHVLPESPTDK